MMTLNSRDVTNSNEFHELNRTEPFLFGLLKLYISAWLPNSFFVVASKGQLISKVLFDVIFSTKKPTNLFKDFCPSF